MAGNIVNNYGSFDVVFVSGQGVILTDVNGKKYIDFVAGIGVNCLGHGHPALVKALQEQAAAQIHISNYYNSDKGLAFSKALLERTGYEKVYFGNSGAEANEAAIKLARKYGHLKDPGGKRRVVVTLKQSFHGRTMATLTATGQDAFHPAAFAPYLEGFKYIEPNDFAALETAFDDSVAALLVECVQGEGGVNLLDPAWAKAAAAAARKAGALVIADEVQTGIGRTGTFLASEGIGLEPDAVTLAKGIAGGVPMGACLFRGPADVFAAGDHQSTFAGNPLACAAGLVVLEELGKPGFLARVAEAGNNLRSAIESWKLPGISRVRGKGLLNAFDFAPAAAGEVQKKCLEAGLCVTTAGKNVVRVLPPLVIGDRELAEGLAILKSVLEGLS